MKYAFKLFFLSIGFIMTSTLWAYIMIVVLKKLRYVI